MDKEVPLICLGIHIVEMRAMSYYFLSILKVKPKHMYAAQNGHNIKITYL